MYLALLRRHVSDVVGGRGRDVEIAEVAVLIKCWAQLRRRWLGCTRRGVLQQLCHDPMASHARVHNGIKPLRVTAPRVGAAFENQR